MLLHLGSFDTFRPSTYVVLLALVFYRPYNSREASL